MYVPFQRDPVSQLFDDGARALLARAYARPGQWAGTRLADPSPRHRSWLSAAGIDWADRDRVPGGEAKTRWARGFVRALYYNHKWYSSLGGGAWRRDRRTVAREAGALVVEVGNVVVARGVIPRGRAVRVKLERGGQAKAGAVARMSEGRTWADQGPRWADPERRDW